MSKTAYLVVCVVFNEDANRDEECVEAAYDDEYTAKLRAAEATVNYDRARGSHFRATYEVRPIEVLSWDDPRSKEPLKVLD